MAKDIISVRLKFVVGFDSIDCDDRPIVYINDTATGWAEAYKKSKLRPGGHVYKLEEVDWKP